MRDQGSYLGLNKACIYASTYRCSLQSWSLQGHCGSGFGSMLAGNFETADKSTLAEGLRLIMEDTHTYR